MFLWVYLVALFVFVLDQLSKNLVLQHLKPVGSIPMPGGFWSLTYSENTGGAFSFLTGHNGFFVAVGLVICGGLLYLLHTQAMATSSKLSLGLVLGGACGNILDRLRHHFVVDFIDFKIWPVFNLADTCICLGIGILILDTLRGEQEEKEAAKVC